MEELRRSIVGEKSSVIPGLGMEGSLDNRCEEGEGAGMTGPQKFPRGKSIGNQKVKKQTQAMKTSGEEGIP